MFRKLIYLSLFLCILNFKAGSQEPWYYGQFKNIFDDREYNSGLAYNQVILGARADGGVGFTIDSISEVRGGLNYMFEYGSDPKALTPVPDLYYKLKTEHFKMQFGSFPRSELLNYPLALLTDTLLYYRPNIQGGFMELNGNWGNQNAWCDWTSRQTMTDDECFLAGGSGHFKYDIFYIEDYFYMYHHANTKPGITVYHNVRDNGGGAFYAGADLGKKTILEKLAFDIGFVGAYDRTRPNPYNHYDGLQIRMFSFYKIFGIDATYYKGDKLPLIYGEPFYNNCGNYARIDAYLKFFKIKQVDLKAGWSFHILNGNYLDNSIQLMLTANLSNRKTK